MQDLVADIVVFGAIPKVLSYRVPEGMRPSPGMRALVPVRHSTRLGVLIALKSATGDGLKDILSLIDPQPLVTQEIIDLLIWCSRYYHAGIGACLALAFPPLLRKAGRRADADLTVGTEIQATPRSLTYSAEQTRAIEAIGACLEKPRFQTFVLHGITGSGKTAVYLACAMRALESGRSVIYMVPEIALTPQTITRIRESIPFAMAVFHSGLSPKTRAEEFLKVAKGGARFVLGTRSAIFAPLTDLGLIIVDEEHDGSYKQDDGVPYNARDLAIMRARTNAAVVVLGSATPSLDSYARIRTHQSTLLTMTSRIGQAELPRIITVDMRGRQEILASELVAAMDETLAKGEQCLLFINRRGFSAAMVCPGCSTVLTCTRCSQSLTYHRSRSAAICHYCGFSLPVPEICPACGCMDMRPLGLGTERVLAEVAQKLPAARILQMDSDEISSPRKLGAALASIRERRVDVIVGTQMIAKGHDFPHLTLVGVMQTEQLLNMPDFRAVERTFQQVLQVAGRAGRTRPDTRVSMQTLIPDHPVIAAITRYDYEAMLTEEEQNRRQAGLPPFAYMARCIFSSLEAPHLEQTVKRIAKTLALPGLKVMGPALAPLGQLRGRYRWHLLLTAGKRATLHRALDHLQQTKIPGRVRMKIDVDPYDML
ncbi:MAG TPA: primosomal protein N' [Deltaproteobacteria bacterium]|nr:primosomal protein N' [Deltaproteobacteria bacterium]